MGAARSIPVVKKSKRVCERADEMVDDKVVAKTALLLNVT